MTRYLDTETVVAINARQDGGVGVRDRAGVEAAVNRAASSFGGVDTFESLWQKGHICTASRVPSHFWTATSAPRSWLQLGFWTPAG